MVKFFVLLVTLFSSFVHASCSLGHEKTLRIGCSYDCDIFYRFRLLMSGWQSGYKIQIVNLNEQANPKSFLESVDGVLIPGGADIDPKFYMNEVSEELRKYTQSHLHLVQFTSEGKKRDAVEYSLLKTYSTDDHYKHMPLVGICRGMQMMAVAQGIPLYLDIKTELGIRNRRNVLDRIKIENETLMDEIFKPSSFYGYKLHHQGVRVGYYHENSSQYPDVRLSAFSHQKKIAEALEYLHRPALGVQYHPERSLPRASYPYFKWFLNQACEYKNLKENSIRLLKDIK
jgi:putative glutamine amidotransferase